MPPAADLAPLELAAVLDCSHDHIVIADGDGRVLRASASCVAVYGIPLAQWIGASVAMLEQQGILSPSVTLCVLRERKRCQVMQRTRTGRNVMAEAIPVWDGGRIVRVVSSSRDMTDIDLLQQEYERVRQQLAARQAADAAARPALTTDWPSANPRMREIDALIGRVAPTDASILLTGETGVGKSRLAAAAHQASTRARGPLVQANCGAIPETLFESEMFGYVAGAFSGAARGGKAGLAERADGGTLFLDEITELSPAMQVKLLRLLQDRCVTRLGSTDARRIDFRLITATNRDLSTAVAEGRFRLDLYHRINVVPIALPPLRERREDLPLFISHMLAGLNARYGNDKTLSPACWSQLLAHDWPGNLRELENTLERLYVISAGTQIEPSAPRLQSESRGGDAPAPDDQTLRAAVEQAERLCLERALPHCASTYELAERLGTSQPTIFRRLRKYGLAIDGAGTSGY